MNRPRPSVSDVITLREAAASLRCSEATIRRIIHRGTLRAVRLGPRGSIRIPKSALTDFLDGSAFSKRRKHRSHLQAYHRGAGDE